MNGTDTATIQTTGKDEKMFDGSSYMYLLTSPILLVLLTF